VDKRYVIVALAAAFTGVAWRLDHAELLNKAENIETVSADYVAERQGTAGFFLLDLQPSSVEVSGEIDFPLERLESRAAASELEQLGITSDSEIVLKGGSDDERTRAAARLMKLLNRSRTVIKKLPPSR
jgi:hypothetical protein